MQVILQAYHSNPGRPTFDHAAHYSPLGNPFDGVVPELRKHGVQKVKDEAEVERTRQKALELRQEVDKFRFKKGDGGNDDDGAPGERARGRPEHVVAGRDGGRWRTCDDGGREAA